MKIILENTVLNIRVSKDYKSEVVNNLAVNNAGLIELNNDRCLVKVKLNGATTIKYCNATIQCVGWCTQEPTISRGNTAEGWLKRTYPVNLPLTIPSDIIDNNPTWIIVDMMMNSIGDTLNIVLV